MATQESPRKFKYIIVGGGLSGLAAGRKLRKDLKIEDFVIVEAHDRVGGRICTHQTQKGNKADLGASWIGPTQTRMYELAREYGLQLNEQYEKNKNILVLPDGKTLHYKGLIPPLSLAVLGRYLINQVKIERLANTVNTENPSLTPNAQQLDSVTFDSFIKQQMKGLEAELVNRAFEIVFGVKTTALSLLQGLYYIKSGQGLDSLFKGRDGAQHHKFVKGTQSLTDAIANELRDKIVIGAPVAEIRQTDKEVLVLTRSGGAFVGEQVIVACPPQALATTVRFSPPLPDARQKYIASIKAPNTCYKLIAFYARPFWRERGLSGLIVQLRGIIMNLWDAETDPSDPRGKLIAFLDMDEYAKLKHLSIEEKGREVAKEIAKFLGPEALDYEEIIPNEIFTKDEFIPGCPTGVAPPGSMTTLNESLYKPHGRIHWASTETARVWQGYMEGAVRSGERAACEVAGVPYDEMHIPGQRSYKWVANLIVGIIGALLFYKVYNTRFL